MAWMMYGPSFVVQIYILPNKCVPMTRKQKMFHFCLFSYNRVLTTIVPSFWWGGRRERDHWGDPDVDGRIILRWTFRKWDGVVGTGWSCLRIGTGGGHL
jgi:hypothetical protein